MAGGRGKSGKKPSFSFFRARKPSRRLLKRLPPNSDPGPNPQLPPAAAGALAAGGGKHLAKRKGGARSWMRIDRFGQVEVLECDKSAIVRRAGVPARDLRVLGPVFSHSSSILARERAIVVNLESIRAIITAEDVLLLDPYMQEVVAFVDQLRQQVPLKSAAPEGQLENQDGENLKKENLEHELPFELQVLEIALEFVCSLLDSQVGDLEKHAYPVLDELAKSVSTKNLELVRSLKSNLTRLLARVQKVRDEIEHLLDDSEDMADLYLTRKQILNQQAEALVGAVNSNSVVPSGAALSRMNSSLRRSLSISHSRHYYDYDVEDVEMLLEAYFMLLDGLRNRILSVREYIDDTEDYVNIQLDNQRNELIRLQLIITMVSFGLSLHTYIVGAFAMNIKCSWYYVDGMFGEFVGITLAGCFAIFMAVLSYAWWKKLLGP